MIEHNTRLAVIGALLLMIFSTLQGRESAKRAAPRPIAPASHSLVSFFQYR